MVLGNKSQMIWDIPPLDTFRVLGEIYHVPPTNLERTVDELIELLEMQELLTKPVRNFSLGERMKCELVALAEYNRRSGATMILTSHYMADVVALCPRVILIHHGRLLYDGELNGLARRLAPFKLIRVTLSNNHAGNNGDLQLPPGVDVVERENGCLTLRVARSEAPSLTAHLLNTLSVADLAVEDPPIEAVIDQIYQEGNV
jgi:ABC-2 type transport system ATP-binding protein